MQTGSLDSLSQPLGGLFSGHTRMRAGSDEPMLVTRVESLGDVSQIWPHIGSRHGSAHGRDRIQGAGVGLDANDVVVRARGEGLERYCTAVFTKDQLIQATAEELGNEAFDLDLVPRCSETELANPLCPLLAPDKRSRIRWVRGISLMNGRPVYLPAIMVFLYTGIMGPGERFWLPITTGCAAHVSLESALVAAILEIIERDAISITWLQQLSLPRLDIDSFPSPLAAYWERYERSSRELEYFFFDATTDMGIPTVYGLQIASANRRLNTLVSCSTSLHPADAVVRVMREMASCRTAFRQARPTPEAIEDFTDIFHGASFMARAEQADAFRFLIESGQTHRLSQLSAIAADNDKQALQVILEILRRKQLEAFAVELSTDEALRAGIRVVRVLIPGLQPVAFNYRARYLGHPRLYQSPKQMGYPVLAEGDLNRWPQPFA